MSLKSKSGRGGGGRGGLPSLPLLLFVLHPRARALSLSHSSHGPRHGLPPRRHQPALPGSRHPPPGGGGRPAGGQGGHRRVRRRRCRALGTCVRPWRQPARGLGRPRGARGGGPGGGCGGHGQGGRRGERGRAGAAHTQTASARNTSARARVSRSCAQPSHSPIHHITGQGRHRHRRRRLWRGAGRPGHHCRHAGPPGRCIRSIRPTRARHRSHRRG